jgi:hypothetical protein
VTGKTYVVLLKSDPCVSLCAFPGELQAMKRSLVVLNVVAPAGSPICVRSHGAALGGGGPTGFARISKGSAG